MKGPSEVFRESVPSPIMTSVCFSPKPRLPVLLQLLEYEDMPMFLDGQESSINTLWNMYRRKSLWQEP